MVPAAETRRRGRVRGPTIAQGQKRLADAFDGRLHIGKPGDVVFSQVDGSHDGLQR